MVLDQLAQRNTHRLFDIARRVHVARQAEDFRAGVAGPADPGKPSGPAPQDRRDDCDRLDIVDRCRTTIETDLCREWRLEARLALAAFEALEQPGLLPADIGARAAMQIEFEIPAGAAGVFADQAGVVALVDRGLQAFGFVIELAADVDVAGVDTHACRGKNTPFDQLVGVVADDVAILAGARLTLIGIDAEIGRAVALF